MKTIVNRIKSVIKARSGFAATVQTLIVKIFILAINIGTGIITARFLGAEGRGEQTAMLIWPQFLAFTMTLGLPKSVLFNLKKHPSEKSELFATTLLMGTGLGLAISLTGIIFIPQWLSQYSPEVIRGAQWLMVFAPLTILGLTFTSFCEAEDDFTTANQLRYLPPLTTLAILVGLIFTQKMNPLNVSLAYELPSVQINIWILFRLWKRYQPTWKNLGNSFRWLLNYGLRCYGIDLMGTLSGRLDQALVVGLLNASSMGLYTVAIRLSNLLNLLQSAIVTVLLPKALARPPKEVTALVGRAGRVNAFFTILVAMPLMIGCPILLNLLYGPEFLGAVSVFRILLLKKFFDGLTGILTQSFLAVGRPETVTIVQGVHLGVTLPLMLILIPLYGLEGAGLALLVSTLVRLGFVLMCYPRLLKVDPPGFIFTMEDFRFLKRQFLLKS